MFHLTSNNYVKVYGTLILTFKDHVMYTIYGMAKHVFTHQIAAHFDCYPGSYPVWYLYFDPKQLVFTLQAVWVSSSNSLRSSGIISIIYGTEKGLKTM